MFSITDIVKKSLPSTFRWSLLKSGIVVKLTSIFHGIKFFGLQTVKKSLDYYRFQEKSANQRYNPVLCGPQPVDTPTSTRIIAILLGSYLLFHCLLYLTFTFVIRFFISLQLQIWKAFISIFISAS